MSSTKHYLFEQCLVLIIGGGEMASGAAYRLVKAGFPVAITELARPMMVRTPVSYGAAAVHKAALIEGVAARQSEIRQARDILATGTIPVMIDPEGRSIAALQPSVIIDARIAQVAPRVRMSDAPLVIGLGSTFTAGVDCHAAVAITAGHQLGRVYWQGGVEVGVPDDHVLYAPADGVLWQRKVPGQRVTAGTVVARIDDVMVTTPIDGVVRGLIDEEVTVSKGMKIGDIDPHLPPHDCFTMAAQALAVGGAVVEAVLSAPSIRAMISA